MIGSPFNFGAARFINPQMAGMPMQQGMTAASLLGIPGLMNQTTVPTPQQYKPYKPGSFNASQMQQVQPTGLLDMFRRNNMLTGEGRQSGGMGGNRSRSGGPMGGGPDRSHGGRF